MTESVSSTSLQEQPWHHLSVQETAHQLRSDPRAGLTSEEISRRRDVYGPNRITADPGTPPWLRFLQQFNQPLLYILLVAGLITLLLRDWVDAGVIFAVVLINAVVGYIQEAKAQQAMEALARSIVTVANVIRNRKQQRLPAEQLVPGDLLRLEAGDKVAADLRLIDARNLHIDESTLTGESVPVDKSTARLAADTQLADRTNLAFAGTIVTSGQGRGLVIATGEATETGKISEMVQRSTNLSTPLSRKIERFSWQLLYVILGLASFTFAVGFGRGEPWMEMFQAAVALAVSGIPEELPPLVTIILAIGVSRMAGRHAIIRKLPAVETLGSATVICSDKTGTLTENQMTVERIYAGGRLYSVSGSGYSTEGQILAEDGPVALEQAPTLRDCLRCGVLCNDANLTRTDGEPGIHGDPTEGALLVVASKAGLRREELDVEQPRRDVIPFESEHQYMATLNGGEGGRMIHLKGSEEAILSRCNRAQDAEGNPTDLDHAAIERVAESLAEKGLRVLALARKDVDCDRLEREDVESGLLFLGLQGMIDPPREEAVRAVHACQEAGIQVKMVTGDHRVTASAIAAMMELSSTEHAPTLSGRELNDLDQEALRNVVEDTAVFARVAPEQKLRLIEALQARGHVVAMTGDGVNDAPALKQADIGIAMGEMGTEVAKEASDIILTDDNFASIEAAVEEGRTVYLNLKKAVAFVLPVNGGELLTILASVMLGTALPILPLQILWLNMVSSSSLSIPLAFEPRPEGVMRQPPRPPSQPLLTGDILVRIVIISVFNWAVTFGMFEWMLSRTADTAVARTMAAQTLVAAEVFYLLCISRFLPSLLARIRGKAEPLAYAPAIGIACVVVLQVLFSQLGVFNHLFSTVPLSWSQWLLCLAAGLPVVVFALLLRWIKPLQ
ncbi:MAG: HAD-IC family P-type ATPase [Synechococcaceae cyanobacterium]